MFKVQINKQKLKKTITIVQNVVFVLILLVFVFALSPMLPLKNVPRMYAVVSGSMEPTIKTGSLAYTIPVNPSIIKTDDIVVFTSPYNSKDVILHRVIGISTGGPLRFVTKGDNNIDRDGWDLMDVGILGKYMFSVPFVGYLTAFVRKPLGFSLLIVVPTLYLIVLQIINVKKGINEEIEKRVQEKIAVKKKKSTKTAVTPVIFLLIAAFLLLGLVKAPMVWAKLSSTVTLSGIHIKTSNDASLYNTASEKNDGETKGTKATNATNAASNKSGDDSSSNGETTPSADLNDGDNGSDTRKENSVNSQQESAETSESASK